MSDAGWGITFVIAMTAVISFAVVTVIWGGLKTRQTEIASKVALARDDAYRALAEQATAAQQQSADHQARIAAELAELRARVTAMETLLREVG